MSNKFRKHIAELDGLRSIAILVVLLWHAGLRAQRQILAQGEQFSLWLPHGGVGVAIFFFLSGLLISTPAANGQPVDIMRFYLNRIWRIHPPYLVALTICFFGLLLTGYKPEHGPSHRLDGALWEHFVASAFYVHNFIFTGPSAIIPPAWSLEVEIQFYILAPLMLAITVLVQNKIVQISLMFSAMLILLLGASAISGGELPPRFFYYTLAPHAYLFVLGMLVAFSLSAANCQIGFAFNKVYVFDAIFALSFAAVLATGFFEDPTPTATGMLIRNVTRIAGIVLMLFGATNGKIFSNILSSNAVTALGRYSFSIYLVHVPVMQAMQELAIKFMPNISIKFAIFVFVPTSILISIFCGYVFHITVERYFINNKPKEIAK